MRILGIILLICCYSALNHFFRLFVQAHNEAKEEIAEKEKSENKVILKADHHIVDNHQS